MRVGDKVSVQVNVSKNTENGWRVQAGWITCEVTKVGRKYYDCAHVVDGVVVARYTHRTIKK